MLDIKATMPAFIRVADELNGRDGRGLGRDHPERARDAMKLKPPFDKPWDVVEVIVPMLPPSANHYVKHTRNGRHYVTKEAKAFFQAVGLAAKGHYVRGDSYTVEIYINLMPGEKGDLDNFAKVCIDGLVKANVIDSDSKVTVLVMHKKRWKSYIPQTQITVWTNDVLGHGGIEGV